MKTAGKLPSPYRIMLYLYSLQLAQTLHETPLTSLQYKKASSSLVSQLLVLKFFGTW